MKPWGTPLKIVSVLDLHLSISIDCRRSEKMWSKTRIYNSSFSIVLKFFQKNLTVRNIKCFFNKIYKNSALVFSFVHILRMYGVYNIKNRVLGTMFIVKTILQIRMVILVELTQTSDASAQLSSICALQWLTSGSFLQRPIQMSLSYCIASVIPAPFSPLRAVAGLTHIR